MWYMKLSDSVAGVSSSSFPNVHSLSFVSIYDQDNFHRLIFSIYPQHSHPRCQHTQICNLSGHFLSSLLFFTESSWLSLALHSFGRNTGGPYVNSMVPLLPPVALYQRLIIYHRRITHRPPCFAPSHSSRFHSTNDSILSIRQSKEPPSCPVRHAPKF